MIETKNLCKRFGAFTAVDAVSLSVEKGEVLGFLGPNGAGKSTTMKMITGFLPPTSGTAVVCGHDVTLHPLEAKRTLGYLPEGAPLYPDMNPAGFLAFIAEVRGFRGAEARKRIDSVVERVQLQEVLHQPIETLSKGFKRRVGLAQAILHDPPVLILDEPTDGLDPNQKHEVRGLIHDMAHDKVIVLSTHILEEVGAVCTRATIIAHGRLVVDCTPDELMARSRWHNAVSLSVKQETAANADEALRGLAGVATVESEPVSDGIVDYVIFPQAGSSIVAAIAERARAERWEVDGLSVQQGRLDEVFRDLTQSEAARS